MLICLGDQRPTLLSPSMRPADLNGYDIKYATPSVTTSGSEGLAQEKYDNHGDDPRPEVERLQNRWACDASRRPVAQSQPQDTSIPPPISTSCQPHSQLGRKRVLWIEHIRSLLHPALVL